MILTTYLGRSPSFSKTSLVYAFTWAGCGVKQVRGYSRCSVTERSGCPATTRTAQETLGAAVRVTRLPRVSAPSHVTDSTMPMYPSCRLMTGVVSTTFASWRSSANIDAKPAPLSAAPGILRRFSRIA